MYSGPSGGSVLPSSLSVALQSVTVRASQSCLAPNCVPPRAVVNCTGCELILVEPSPLFGLLWRSLARKCRRVDNRSVDAQGVAVKQTFYPWSKHGALYMRIKNGPGFSIGNNNFNHGNS